MYTLHQKREQLRWHSLQDGANRALSNAAKRSAEQGLEIPADYFSGLLKKISKRYQVNSPNIFAGFYEFEGAPVPGIAAARWYPHSNELTALTGTEAYRSSHLGSCHVVSSDTADRGATLLYRSVMPESGAFELYFSGPPQTLAQLFEASHALVDDFAISTLRIEARS